MGRAARKGTSTATPRTEEIPSQGELLRLLEEIRVESRKDPDHSLLPAEMQERMIASSRRRLLRLQTEIAEFATSLPDRDWYPSEREYIYHKLLGLGTEAGHDPSWEAVRELSKSHPLLERVPPEKIPLVCNLVQNLDLLPNSPSGTILRKIVKEALGEKELWDAATEDYYEASHLASLVAALRASEASGDPRIEHVENILHDNFDWASERSQLQGKKSEHPSIVLTLETSWPLSKDAGGFCCNALPGDPEKSVTVVCAQSLEMVESAFREVAKADGHPDRANIIVLDEQLLRKIMLHEMIHDTQGLKGPLPEGWERTEQISFNEALTEGLTVLRMRSEGEKLQDALRAVPVLVTSDGKVRRITGASRLTNKFAYQKEVVSLFRALEKAGIPDKEFADRLEYLNTLGNQDAIATLSAWLGEDFRQVFIDGMESYQKEDRAFVDRIFRATLST